MALNITDLTTLIDTNLPDNNTNLIDPQAHREVLYEVISSYANLITNENVFGLSDFDPARGYKEGNCVVYTDNNIYQAKADVPVGAWNPSLFEIISSYIDSTNGLADYRKIENSIDTPNHLAVYLADDSVLTSLDTGFYVVNTNNAGLVGLDKDYPVISKGVLINQKGNSASETFQVYYNLTDYSNSYIRKESGDWVNPSKSINKQATTIAGATSVNVDCSLYDNITITQTGNTQLGLVNVEPGVYVITVKMSTTGNALTTNTSLGDRSSNSVDLTTTTAGGYAVYTVVVLEDNTTYHTIETVNI